MNCRICFFLFVVLLAMALGCSKDKVIAPPPPITLPPTLQTEQITITQVHSDSTVDLYSVWFIDANTGYVCGSGGTILKTTNGGTNWTALNTTTTGQINSIRFTNVNTGYACDDKGNVLKTIDAGATWQITNLITNGSLNSVFFINDNTGYVGGGYYGLVSKSIVFKTIDGGATWTKPDSTYQSTFINSIFFKDITTGYFGGVCFCTQGPCCEWLGIGKTTDGGALWTIHKKGDYIYSIFFTGSQTGFAVGDINPYFGIQYYSIGGPGTILKTTDAGNSWNEQILDSTATLRGIYFTNSSTGYIAGGSATQNSKTGKIWRTTDAGSSWTKLNVNTSNILYGIHFPATNTGYAIGAKGTVFKITISMQ